MSAASDAVQRQQRSWLWMALTLAAIVGTVLIANLVLGIDAGVRPGRRLLHAALLGFGLTSALLLIGTLTTWSTNARPRTQAGGLAGAMALAAALFGLLIGPLGASVPLTGDGDVEQWRTGMLRVIISSLAAGTGAGLVFGLLLGFINGRPAMMLDLDAGDAGSLAPNALTAVQRSLGALIEDDDPGTAGDPLPLHEESE